MAKKNTAPFPAEVKAPVQYGERIRAAATYLHVYHLLPYERLAGLFADPVEAEKLLFDT